MKVEISHREAVIIHQSLKDLCWSISEILEEYKQNKSDSQEVVMNVQIREKQFCEAMAVLEKFEELNPTNILF